MLHKWRFLTGSLPELKRVWRAYGIEAAVVKGLIDHTPATYVIDSRGRLSRLYLTQMCVLERRSARVRARPEPRSAAPRPPASARRRVPGRDQPVRTAQAGDVAARRWRRRCPARPRLRAASRPLLRHVGLGGREPQCRSRGPERVREDRGEQRASAPHRDRRRWSRAISAGATDVSAEPAARAHVSRRGRRQRPGRRRIPRAGLALPRAHLRQRPFPLLRGSRREGLADCCRNCSRRCTLRSRARSKDFSSNLPQPAGSYAEPPVRVTRARRRCGELRATPKESGRTLRRPRPSTGVHQFPCGRSAFSYCCSPSPSPSALALVRPLQVRATRPAKRHPAQPAQLLPVARAVATSAASPTDAAEVLGHRVVTYARHFIGIPYSWGGSSPRTGFDCSGLVRFVYGHFGIRLPHSSWADLSHGRRVGRRFAPGRRPRLLLRSEPRRHLRRRRPLHRRAAHRNPSSASRRWGWYGYYGARRSG